MYCIISIHAPTRGATMVGCCLHFNHIYFNPRSHERSDNLRKQFPYNVPISIHAPTRGATGSGNAANGFKIFQSTLPREERPGGKTLTDTTTLFQSTLPREERQSRPYNFSITSRFQSTLPREERQNTEKP